MKKAIQTTALLLPAFSALAAAPDADRVRELEEKLNALEQRYRVLERRWELDQEAADTKAKSAPTVSLGAGGLAIQTADTNFAFRVRGLVQADSRFYFDDGGIANNDAFLIRRARPIFEGTFFRDFDYQFVAEFGGTGSPSLLDANLNYRFRPELQFRAGKFKAPIGLEQLQSDPVRFLSENALPTGLVPNRDVGFQLHGEIRDGLLQYQAGVFNGLGDGRSSNNGDFDDDKEFAARIFAHPFKLGGPEFLRGLGLGGSGSWGERNGANGLPAGYATEGQQTFFSYAANAVADGETHRLSPQLYYYVGPFGLLAEYVVSGQDVRIPARSDSLQNSAWQVTASWVLTGEDAGFRGVTPRRPFSLRDGSWGAFQAVARVSQLEADDDAFSLGYANPATSAREATAWTVGVNWYLNRNVRANLSYTQTDFDGGAAASADRQTEKFLVSRFQLSF